MKKLTQMAMFIFAIFSAQFVGQAQVKILDRLPNTLPIGGTEKEVVTWIVTNRPSSFGMTFEFGEGGWYQTGSREWYKTYDEFQNKLISAGLRLTSSLKKDGIPLDTIITLVADVGYCRLNSDGSNDDENYSRGGITINQEIGRLDQLTTRSFTEFKIETADMGMAIKNLEFVRVEREGEEDWEWYIGNEPLPVHYSGEYSYYDFPPFVDPIRPGQPHVFGLNKDEIFGKKRVRITLKVAGQTATYTQHGTKLVKRVGDSLVVTPTGVALNTSFPQGADVRLESSPDLINWSVVNTFQFWNTGKTSSILDIPTHSQYKNHLFFRTVPE